MKPNSANVQPNESDFPVYIYKQGNNYESYRYFGAHLTEQQGEKGVLFRVWAPHARAVSVVGDFNNWVPGSHPMRKVDNDSVWEVFIPGMKEYDVYKYCVTSADDRLTFKSDPYAFHTETRPSNGSKVYDLSGFEWHDAAWHDEQKKKDIINSPMNVYELHAGSWKMKEGDVPYNYTELADLLIPYLVEMGYTHVELLPITEYPFDGSWGYQVTGYFAPTSRYGTPKDFMTMVDKLHGAGIGVIMDWVPGGFCADAHGLATFNGQMLYEHEIHPNWGTHKFDFSRGEVRSFLVSNALYWVEAYHIDGIRMDGVSSMLYMNFGIDDPGQKRFNKNGTEEDLDASAFIRQTNLEMGRLHPDVMMIAEESTAWPLVTYPPKDGGLGFHFKWDMGWMNDTLHYMQTDFPWRPGNHRMLTFSTMYQFNENFVLPLSHDEVVNGKCSLITRMQCETWRQFAGLRALALYQMTHAGGKLNFMGNEIGQFIEWRYYEGIEYFLAEQFETHRKQQAFIAALNAVYNEQPALWQRAFEGSGFEWIDADNADQSIISFVRHGDKPKDDLVILINMDVNAREDFRMGVPEWCTYGEVFNSDEERFGGSGVVNNGRLKCEDVPWNGREQSIVVRVPPLGGAIFKRVAAQRKPASKTAVAAAKPAAPGEKPALAAGATAAPGAKPTARRQAKPRPHKKGRGKK